MQECNWVIGTKEKWIISSRASKQEHTVVNPPQQRAAAEKCTSAQGPPDWGRSCAPPILTGHLPPPSLWSRCRPTSNSSCILWFLGPVLQGKARGTEVLRLSTRHKSCEQGAGPVRPALHSGTFWGLLCGTAHVFIYFFKNCEQKTNSKMSKIQQAWYFTVAETIKMN